MGFLGVVAVAVLELDVDQLLHPGRERHHRGRRHRGPAHRPEPVDQLHPFGGFGVLQPHGHQHQQPLADQFRRHERQRGHVVLERRVVADRARQRRVEGPVLAQGLGSIFLFVERDPDPHHRAELLGPEREPGDDAEVAATAAQGPHQLRVVGLGDLDDLTAGQHQLQGDELVAGQAVGAGEPADAAAQGQPGHPGLGHDAGRDDQPVRGGGRVHVTQAAAAAHVDQLVLRVHGDLAQAAQVEGQAAFGHALAGHVVAAAADRGVQAVLAGHVDRGHHVGGAGTAQDQAGTPVDHGVPQLAGRLVLGVVRGR